MSGRPRPWTRFSRWLALSVAVVASLGVGSYLYVAGRIARQLREARSATDPGARAASDGGWRSADGEDPSPWLEQVADVPDPEWTASSVVECAAHAGSSAAADALLSAARERWLDLSRPDPLTACELALLVRELEENGRVLDLAREVERYGTLDHAGWLARRSGLEAEGGASLPVASVLTVGITLARAAVLAAARGDVEATRAHLGRAFRASHLVDPGSSVLALIGWTEAAGAAVGALARAAHWLPAGVDLWEFESSLDELDPGREVERAWIGERAFGTRAFERVRRGEMDDALELLGLGAGPLERLWIDANEAEYLRQMEVALRDARARSIARTIPPPASAGLHALAATLLPFTEQIHRPVAALCVQRDLVHAALIARRDGLESAVAWIAAREDPFARAPYSARIEGSTLILASVGPNSRDDGGGSVPRGAKVDDIVLRFTLR